MERERPLSPVPIADKIDHFVILIGRATAWVYVLLMITIIAQVVLRKGFSSGLIALEELQWHFYAIGFMIGLSYSQALDSHVRVDLFYNRFPARVKHAIEIIGIVLFIFPAIYVVIYHSLDFVYDAWRTNETSNAPAGLPHRWLIKSLIPASFSLLAIAVINRLYREVVLFLKGAS